MSEHDKELLSAYLDDELTQAEFDRLNRQLPENPELQSTLNRYSMISEGLKGNCAQCNAADIAKSVSQALQDEPTIFAPNQIKHKTMPAWLKPLAGSAIAATVATLAVINLSDFISQGSSSQVFPVTVVDAKPSVQFSPFSGELAQKASTHWKTHEQNAELEEELNRLMIDHSEYSSETGVPGMIPYASFVSYDQK